MQLIPKYTRAEIISMLNNALFNNEKSLEFNIKENDLNKLFSLKALWMPNDYKLASKIIGIDVEELLSHLPEEDLNQVSFRALENNDLIHEKVNQLNDIFETLTYQLKIGSVTYD
ncbi:MAG TPA: hypothetical protein DCO67_06425 [Staphylococcus sp.]|nr:hypothetical protein [Staphylococcus sp.]